MYGSGLAVAGDFDSSVADWPASIEASSAPAAEAIDIEPASASVADPQESYESAYDQGDYDAAAKHYVTSIDLVRPLAVVAPDLHRPEHLGHALLREVADLVYGPQGMIGDAIINDGPGLMLIVEKFPWGNTLELTRRIEAELADIGRTLPEGMAINSEDAATRLLCQHAGRLALAACDLQYQ